MLSRCFLDFSVGVWAFVIGLSQISSFLSYFDFYQKLVRYCFKNMSQKKSAARSFTEILFSNKEGSGAHIISYPGSKKL